MGCTIKYKVNIGFTMIVTIFKAIYISFLCILRIFIFYGTTHVTTQQKAYSSWANYAMVSLKMV